MWKQKNSFWLLSIYLYSVSSSLIRTWNWNSYGLHFHQFIFLLLIMWCNPHLNYFAQINKGVFVTSSTNLHKTPFAYPAGDPSLQVTERFFKKCSLMSSSSLCEEHVYSDCAKFCNWTKKCSVFALTGVKSNGMLSAPPSRSLVVRGWRSRRVCARAPGRLFVSTGAHMWMKSSSRQERTVDRPVELFITPRFHSVLKLNKRNSGVVQRSFKKDGNLLKNITIGRAAEGYVSPWSTFSEEELLQFTLNTHVNPHPFCTNESFRNDSKV